MGVGDDWWREARETGKVCPVSSAAKVTSHVAYAIFLLQPSPTHNLFEKRLSAGQGLISSIPKELPKAILKIRKMCKGYEKAADRKRKIKGQ